jgi:hypothetical protein
VLTKDHGERQVVSLPNNEKSVLVWNGLVSKYLILNATASGETSHGNLEVWMEWSRISKNKMSDRRLISDAGRRILVNDDWPLLMHLSTCRDCLLPSNRYIVRGVGQFMGEADESLDSDLRLASQLPFRPVSISKV